MISPKYSIQSNFLRQILTNPTLTFSEKREIEAFWKDFSLSRKWRNTVLTESEGSIEVLKNDIMETEGFESGEKTIQFLEKYNLLHTLSIYIDNYITDNLEGEDNE